MPECLACKNPYGFYDHQKGTKEHPDPPHPYENAELDIRNQPSINIVDTYAKSGKHLGRKISTEDGRVVEEEGPNSNRDVVFLPPEWRERWNQVVAHKWPPEDIAAETMKKIQQGIIDAQLDLLMFSMTPPGCRTASGIEALKDTA